MSRHLITAALVFGLFTPGVASAQSVDEVMASFAGEPTILEVQEAAAAYAQIDQGVMEGWSTRASLAALLPDVRVQYQRRVEDDLQMDDDQDLEVDELGDLVLTDVARDVRTDDDTQSDIRIQGDFELNELVWNPDLLRVSKEIRDVVELREDILTTVTTLFFERRRAQVQLQLSPPSDPIERLRRELEIQELTASIDALTGGWFSAQLSAAGLPSY